MKITNKLAFAFSLTFIISLSNISAQNDCMYIMKDGNLIGKFNVYSEVDSIIFYEPAMEEPSFGTFIDARNGREYNWVRIGNQEWMVENLSYAPPSGNYWAYNNNVENIEIYGYLYDWETALNVCPPSWHLPSDEEWTELTEYLGENAGSKLKAIGSVQDGMGFWQLWQHGGVVETTNETGFTALPGGSCGYDETFSLIGFHGYWWSATEYIANLAWLRRIYYSGHIVERANFSKEIGFSVRCLRD
jgi:uncharacterized protein (TIGR02145 family)